MAGVLFAAAWVSLVIHAIALSWIDARTHRLPNRLLASCAGIGVGLMAAAAILGGDAAPVLRGLAVGTGALALFALAHVLGGGRTDVSELVGRGTGDAALAATEFAQQRLRHRMRRAAHAH